MPGLAISTTGYSKELQSNQKVQYISYNISIQHFCGKIRTFRFSMRKYMKAETGKNLTVLVMHLVTQQPVMKKMLVTMIYTLLCELQNIAKTQ